MRLLLLCLLASPLFADEPLMRHHFVDDDLPGSQWAMLTVADIDGDTRPDVIVAPSKWSSVTPKRAVWYRNTGSVGEWAGPQVIANEIVSDCGLAAADLNADGRIDLIFSAMWLENLGRIGGELRFATHIFDPDLTRRRKRKGRPTYGAHDIVMADLDGDGSPEVVTHGDKKNNDALFVYDPPSDPTRRWLRHTITKPGDVHAALAPAGVGDVSGDVSGDGRPDIVYVDRWYENTGDLSQWREHRNFEFGKAGPWGIGVRSVVADIDGDGHNDIVQSGCDVESASIVWVHNAVGDGSKWERHTLPMSLPPGDFHSLAVADLDGDGDLDIYADEMEHIHVAERDGPKFRMLLWKNADGRGTRWEEVTLTAGLGGHEAKAVDLDGDGDVDIVTKCFTAGENANGGRLHVSAIENLTK